MENEVMMSGSDDPILPDGWTEGMDIFADSDGEANDFFADEADPFDTTPAEEAEQAHTTEPEAETVEGETTSEEAPTTETEPETIAAPKLRFKAKVDHQDIDVEVDEAELPTLYQKAQATDRAQQRLGEIRPTYDAAEKLARQMGYQSAQEMLDAAAENYRNAEVSRLVEDGVNEELARDYVNRHMENAGAANGLTTTAEADTHPAEASQTRDYNQEAGELLRLRPELRGKSLPDEVMKEVTLNGKPLVNAYLEYEARQKTAEIEQLRKENNIYKQNAEAAARSPVTGTAGGGATDTKPSDPFMTGFDSGW
jgi:hypothetical protein